MENYFSKVIRNHNGYYIPLNELQDYFNGKLKINVNYVKEKNILDRIDSVQFYNIQGQEDTQLLTLDASLKNNDEIYYSSTLG